MRLRDQLPTEVVERDAMSAIEKAQFVMMCFDSPGFVREYDRLTGSNLCGKGTPIDVMIDDATGRISDEAAGFAEFCADVYSRALVR